jgi:N-dimethylarginine dimethylaminohydrolase
VNEAAHQDAVVEYARLTRWRVAHFRRALNKRGVHMTAVAYDAKGFPDLVLVRDRVVFAELKAKGRKRTPEQEAWAEWLEAAGAEYHLWRPTDWDEIVRVLA